MELRQLTTFRMVATTLSFTRTAAALNYVQSSVTAQIQALEEELGVRLFDRLGKRVVLTDAGERLLTYAEKILALSEEARLAVSDTDEPVGTLTISATDTLCAYRLPALLQQFRLSYPHVRLEFRPISFSQIRQSVAEGEIDIGFEMEESMAATGLMIEPLIREPLVLIAPPEHRLVQLECVGPANLEGESMLLTEAGCSYRNMFQRALAREGIRPASVVEFNSVEAIKQCVMVGMGVTVLPKVTVESEIAQGRLVDLAWDMPDFYILTHMIWHKEKWLSPALQAFLKMARETLSTPAQHECTAAPVSIAQP
jgi:DNA-binding transcriptional LysR family regulator